MKRIKNTLIAAVVAVCFSFGFAVSPVTGYAEEVVEVPPVVEEVIPETPETEIPPAEELPPVEEEEKPSTFDEFLQWTEMEAEKYGHGESFKDALKAIKTAATTKQVTISTVCSIAVAVLILAYIVRSKIKDKSYKKSIIDCANQLNSLIKGANELVDETNIQVGIEKTTQNEVKRLESQVQSLQHGLKDFTTAFLRFADGVKIGDAKKSEVQSNCISAIKSFDEVTGDENNKK